MRRRERLAVLLLPRRVLGASRRTARRRCSSAPMRASTASSSRAFSASRRRPSSTTTSARRRSAARRSARTTSSSWRRRAWARVARLRALPSRRRRGRLRGLPLRVQAALRPGRDAARVPRQGRPRRGRVQARSPASPRSTIRATSRHTAGRAEGYRRAVLLKACSGAASARSPGRTPATRSRPRCSRALRPRPVRKDDVTPAVTVIVPAHDEEAVIGARLDNLLALDYPAEQLEILVASDGSTDGTDEIVEGLAAREPRVSLLALPARRQARGAEPRRRARPTPRSSPSPTRTRRGRPTRCASSSATSPTPTSATSAGSSGSSAPTARTGRASTGATSSGCGERVGARLDHRRQRRHLRRAPLGLRR